MASSLVTGLLAFKVLSYRNTAGLRESDGAF